MEIRAISVEDARASARNLQMDSKTETTILQLLEDVKNGEGREIFLNETEDPAKIAGQIKRVAKVRFNQMPVAVRKSGTDRLVCWKLSDEEIQDRKERTEKLQAGRQKRRGGRKRTK